MKSLKGLLSVYPEFYLPATELGSRTKVLDPEALFLQRLNKFFVLSCTMAVSLDPLFFYIFVVDSSRMCLDLDNKLKVTACVLRSMVDFFYILHIILQFYTGYVPSSSSRVYAQRELITDLPAIAKRYLCSYFTIDILAVLPLPQVIVLIIGPNIRVPTSMVIKNLLKITIFIQYVPRLTRIYPLYKEATKQSGIMPQMWAGVAFNFSLYLIASNVAGALWYLFSIERQERCWRIACRKYEGCDPENLYCGVERPGDYSFLTASCPLLEPNEVKNLIDFDFGIFLDALRSRVVEKRNFLRKLLYCFWWGLRNLSSMGQNLQTSNFTEETIFAIAISIVGLILFSLLIGNMQKYLQSMSSNIEDVREKRRDAERWERWMSYRMLPNYLRQRIWRYKHYKWQETRGVEEDNLIQDLPKDLKRDINRHIRWNSLLRVPIFEEMDDQLLDILCDRLKPVLYTENAYIIREGDTVDEMHFIMRGTLQSVTQDGGGFFNRSLLKAGDFFGEELFDWALDPRSSTSLPTSVRSVQALTGIEAFALMADDLKSVAAHYRRLHSRKVQNTLRFHSQQWRTWAACFIQAAWRRYCRNKLERSLKEEEEKLQGLLEIIIQ